jgi:hypothetical protein
LDKQHGEVDRRPGMARGRKRRRRAVLAEEQRARAHPDSCCVSGVRGAGVVEPRNGAVETSIDRFGGDYRDF